MEEWRTHPSSGYLVSENGRIVNPKTGFELKHSLSVKGYLRIGNYICRSGMVHTAVIEAFSGDIVPKGMQVNHIDGNKLNNHYSNLEVCTPSENTRHAYKLGLATGKKGEEAGGAKVTENQILEMYQMFEDGFNNEQVGELFNLHDRYVSLVRHGKRWKHVYDRIGKVFPKSYKEISVPKAKILEAWELIKTTNLINKRISEITGIEASTISRLRSGEYGKTIVELQTLEQNSVDNPK